MKFNINSYVRVKLTDRGRRMHAKMYAPHDFEVKEDADGWSEWQLWDLMHTFGRALWHGTRELPFEIDIEIPTDGKPVADIGNPISEQKGDTTHAPV